MCLVNEGNYIYLSLDLVLKLLPEEIVFPEHARVQLIKVHGHGTEVLRVFSVPDLERMVRRLVAVAEEPIEQLKSIKSTLEYYNVFGYLYVCLDANESRLIGTYQEFQADYKSTGRVSKTLELCFDDHEQLGTFTNPITIDD